MCLESEARYAVFQREVGHAFICRCSKDSQNSALSIFTEGKAKGMGLNDVREN